MAASNWFMYGPALEGILNGTIDMDSDSFRMALVTSSYSPNQTSHDTWSDVSANEVANGNGYATHGQALTPNVTRSGLAVTIDADDQSWANSTITAKYAVIVRDSNGDGSLAAGDLVVGYCDLNTSGNAVSTSASFDVNFSGSGALTATAPAAP